MHQDAHNESFRIDLVRFFRCFALMLLKEQILLLCGPTCRYIQWTS